MPFPVAHGVVASGLFIGLQRRLSLSQDWRPILLCTALSILPDLDFALEWFLNFEDAHRSFTHSLIFCVGLGVLSAFLFGASNIGQRLAIMLAPLSHTVLDVVVTSRQGAGVELFWPVSNYRYKLVLIDYFGFEFNPTANSWSEIFLRAGQITLFETIVCVPLFLILAYLKSRRGTKHSTQFTWL